MNMKKFFALLVFLAVVLLPGCSFSEDTSRIYPNNYPNRSKLIPPPTRVDLLKKSHTRTRKSLRKVKASSGESAKSDFVFVIDATGSMWPYIDAVKSNVSMFAEELNNNEVDVRFSIVEFRDVTCSEPTTVHRFNGGKIWTVSADEVVSSLASIEADGGGDDPETPTEAINTFFNTSSGYASPFRSDASHFMFILTDADSKSEYGYYSGIPTMAETAALLRRNSVHTVVVSRPEYEEHYKSLWNAYTGGMFIDINSDYYDMMLSVADLIYEVSGLTVKAFERARKTDDTTTLNPESTNAIAYVNSEGKYVTHTGNEISENVIANLGSSYEKKGYTADGNTRLIIRVQNNKPGSVQFSINEKYGTLETLDRTQKGNSLYVESVPVKDFYQASVVLIAPESYPYESSIHPSSAVTDNFPSTSFNVNVDFADKSANHESENLSLSLNATPVLLVHGLTSDYKSAFGVGKTDSIYSRLTAHRMTVNGYDYGGYEGPTYHIIQKNSGDVCMNVSGMFIKIAEAMHSMHEKDIACTRVDLVCHSMGGLMARTFLAYEDGQSERSYKQSMIRRVVTIATPYEGSPFPSIFLGEAENLPYVKAFRAGEKHPASYDVYEDIVNIITNQYLRNRIAKVVPSAPEAWKDLALGSALINELHGKPYTRPLHVIYGGIRDVLPKAFGLLSGTLNTLMNGEDEDFYYVYELHPEYLNMFMPEYIAYVTTIPSLIGDYDYFKAFTDVLFNENDFDLVVGEDSARSTFSETAMSPCTVNSTWYDFAGGEAWNFWHNALCHQADVSSLVFDLLKAGDKSFDKSGVNSSAVSSSAFLSSVKSSGLMRSLPVNVKDEEPSDDDYFVNVLPLTAELSDGSILTAPETITVIPPANIIFRIVSEEPVMHNVYMSLMTENGGSFALMASKDEELKEFVMSFDIQSTDTGIISLHCFSQGEEENVYISDTLRLVIQPNLEIDGDSVNSILFMNPGLISITSIDSEVGTSLFASTDKGRLIDISAPAMGTLWTADDPEIAEVTETGKIRGIKSGSTVLRASYEGYEASVSVDVAVQYDVTPTPEPSSKDLFIMTRSLPEGKAGITYSAALDTTLSLTDAITWTVTGLPETLSCNSYGVINGKPVEPGTYSLGITASNGDESDSANLTLRINSADIEGAPIISTVSLPDAYVSKDYSFTLKAVGENLSWSITGGYFPSEFELNSEGVISGRSDSPGSCSFYVMASNAYGHDIQFLTLSVVSEDAKPAPAPKPEISPDNPAPVPPVSPDVSPDIRPEPVNPPVSPDVSPDIRPAPVNPPVSPDVSPDIRPAPVNPPVSPDVSPDIKPEPEPKPEPSPDNPAPVSPVSPDVSPDIKPEPEPEPESEDIIIGDDRTILSLSVSELAEVSNDTSMIAAVLPEITVSVSGIYDFDAELFDDVRTGAKLIWHPFVRESVSVKSAEYEYEYAVWFYDDEGREITEVPENHKIKVSAYLEEGKTYAPVIAAEIKKSEEPVPEPVPEIPENNDIHMKNTSSSGGGCNIMAAGLAMIAAAIIFLKRR